MHVGQQVQFHDNEDAEFPATLDGPFPAVVKLVHPDGRVNLIVSLPDRQPPKEDGTKGALKYPNGVFTRLVLVVDGGDPIPLSGTRYCTP